MKAKRIGSKPVKQSEKVNPFEVKVNRQKHDVLGRKSKSDRGLLGVSRNKAIKKRKATLLQEYVSRNKSSTFMDKRIGEFDATMNPDDKMAARLAQERKISHKKNVFSLNEEEELTHLGKSINDMETHDDPRSDDEDLYDKVGRDFTEKTNFGGFLTKADPNSDAAKSRREAIDQLIAESKKLKHERQVEKDENFELTEKLDKEWKEFQSLLAASKSKKSAAEDKETSTDDYDVLVKQLKFAPLAGQASERVKTEDEIAQAEKKRLEKLEHERKARAQGIEAKRDARKRQLASADDLDDSFYKRERITGTAKQGESDEDEFEENKEAGSATGVESKESDVSDDEGGTEEEDASEEDSYADLASDNGATSNDEEPKDDTDSVTGTSKTLKEPVDFLRGIFVANVFLEYVSYSKRFSPELLIFLARLLSHSTLKLKNEESAVAADESEFKLPLKALGSIQVEMTDELKLKIVHAGVKLVEKCACLYETLPSYRELCDPLSAVCQKLMESAYPESLRAAIGHTLVKLSRKIERKPLKPSKKPPPMKPLLEPNFSMKFDGRKHFLGGEKKVELKRLNYQYKKEMKGAMREVRRDNQFLAQHILKEQMVKDAERKEKVKQIYKELASQEGEYKALKRKKEKLSNRM
ncbi:hypothetical protein HPB50_011651 [Hyalomma asiaticum]|uniref:Uncharacterized protein n=1 Tax=Hyalomma asiaticum TaxID=266040 RepID=A0ACB7SMX6_HYAAI|nr:hypothetical protein HPB50_011651 [Hyalomma asiaticum]